MSKNVLPPCKEDKSDAELISLVKDGDSEAFTVVCKKYENIFYKICQKYVSALSMSGVNPQDVFDEKNFIIYYCISTFKSNKKAKLSTWIGNYARYLCLNSINARKFLLPSSDEQIKKHIEDAQASHDYFIGSRNKKEEFKYVLNIIDQIKDERVGEIFKYRYFSDKKMIWADIAKSMNISTQTAINLHNKGIKILKEKLKSKSISDVI